ncbi:MAG TPA: signal peptidase I [Gammaproteobacteria bacterium]|nr:signal peptidase I [Gammaproteobacteria bacterium]
MKPSFTKLLRDYRPLLVFAVLLVSFRTTIADWSPIPSGSMEPTLFPGDVVWIDKTAFGPSIPIINKKLLSWGHPERGDIITFVPPHTDQLYVKRVIGLPGDSIRIDGMDVYVNGSRLLQQPTSAGDDYLLGTENIDGRNHGIQLTRGLPVPWIGRTIQVPEGKYFVMGDHRNNSADSRFWGFVDEDKIMGRVTAVALSISPRRGWKRFARPVHRAASIFVHHKAAPATDAGMAAKLITGIIISRLAPAPKAQVWKGRWRSLRRWSAGRMWWLPMG